MRLAEATAYGNPSSAHAQGRKARQALENAREQIASLLGAHPDEVTFTSGATEANNLAILGQAPTHCVASQLEHPCVLEPLRQRERHGAVVEWWPVDLKGYVVPQPLHPNMHFLCLMLANHETGALQPVRAVAERLPRQVAFHCDAVQAVGKLPVHFHELGVTSLSASAHKFGGPKGIGVLLVTRGTKWPPLMFGGHQQQGRRPGTEAVPLAVGMAAALAYRMQHQREQYEKLEQLRAAFWTHLHQRAAPLALNGPEIGSAEVVPGTLNVSFPGCRADLLLMALDLAQVACSTGSACSSGSLLPSPVLQVMCVPDSVLRSALRFSFDPNTEFADIEEAANRIGTAVRNSRESGFGSVQICERNHLP